LRTHIDEDLLEAIFEAKREWLESGKAKMRAKLQELIAETDETWRKEQRMAFFTSRQEVLSRVLYLKGLQFAMAKDQDNMTAVRFILEQIKGYKAEAAKIKSELYLLSSNREPKEGDITSRMIQTAKEYPMENLITFNRSGFASCPWHQEKTPSLHKMRNANKVYCFGCHKSADPIDWVQQRDGVDFPTAVRSLQ
jgi:hypothetical protein